MREKIIVLIISNLFINFANLIVNFLLIASLDIAQVGIIAYSTSIIGFSTMFMDIGLGYIYLQRNAEPDFDEYFTIYFSYKIILIFGSYTPLLILVLMLNIEQAVFDFLILKIVSTFLDNLIIIWVSNLNARIKVIKLSIVNVIINVVKNGLVLILLLNYDIFSNPLIPLGQIYIFCSFLNFLVILIFSKGEFKFMKIDKKKMIDFLKATKPLILMSVLGALVINTGYILLDISDSHEALAYYYVIYNFIIVVLLIISKQIQSFFLTSLPKEFEQGNFKEIEDMTHKAEKYSSLLFLSIIIIVFLNIEILFSIFLPNYMDSLIYMYILIFIPYFGGINKPYSSHLIPAKKQRLFSYYGLIKQILNLILIIIIIPDYFFSIRMLGWGGFGLAIITLGSWGVDLYFVRLFSKKLGISWNKKIILHFILAIFAFSITFGLSILIIREMISNDILYVLITSCISLGLFFGSLIVFKEVTKEDLHFFQSLLNLKKYSNSLKAEMKISKDQ